MWGVVFLCWNFQKTITSKEAGLIIYFAKVLKILTQTCKYTHLHTQVYIWAFENYGPRTQIYMSIKWDTHTILNSLEEQCSVLDQWKSHVRVSHRYKNIPPLHCSVPCPFALSLASKCLFSDNSHFLYILTMKLEILGG